jgi:hypothetical protein
MSLMAVVLVVLTGAVFPVLLWTIGRAVTATGGRAPGSRGQPRQYLAGRLDGVRIAALIDGGDELLVSLTTPATNANPATGGALAQVFRVTASECSLGRVRRWRGEATILRGYLSPDGATSLPIPRWAGTPPANQLPPSPGRLASGQSQDQAPSDDS